MIGRRALPDKYVEFNRRWGAPSGLPAAHAVPLSRRLREQRAEFGPFAFQLSGGTRAFEYPWVFYAADTSPGSRVLDVGGCVGGLQFVFALEGCRVVNVDPFEQDAAGWPVARAAEPVESGLHQRLNALFDTDVELVRGRIQDADLPDGSFDRAVSVSVLEHLGQADAEAAVARVGHLLTPGGLFVATIDLFLDLEPFGVLPCNGYGTNLDVSALIASSGLELLSGDRRELLGFAEFDRDRIVALLGELLIAAKYPVVSQAIVLRKPR